MSQNQKLKLDELIKNSDFKDNTEHIRGVKHSSKIEDDIYRFLSLKKKYSRTSKETFESMCMRQCSFLFNNYTDIYNRLIRDELNLELFGKFIQILKKIENGEEDQTSASVMVGTILKEIYVDTALRRENKNKQKEDTKNKKRDAVKNMKNKVLKEKYPEEYNKATMSWKDYKNKMEQSG
jgi:hypothetical protein